MRAGVRPPEDAPRPGRDHDSRPGPAHASRQGPDARPSGRSTSEASGIRSRSRPPCFRCVQCPVPRTGPTPRPSMNTRSPTLHRVSRARRVDMHGSSLAQRRCRLGKTRQYRLLVCAQGRSHWRGPPRARARPPSHRGASMCRGRESTQAPPGRLRCRVARSACTTPCIRSSGRRHRARSRASTAPRRRRLPRSGARTAQPWRTRLGAMLCGGLPAL